MQIIFKREELIFTKNSEKLSSPTGNDYQKFREKVSYINCTCLMSVHNKIESTKNDALRSW